MDDETIARLANLAKFVLELRNVRSFGEVDASAREVVGTSAANPLRFNSPCEAGGARAEFGEQNLVGKLGALEFVKAATKVM